MIYLASPYTSVFKDEEHKRYLETMKIVSELMRNGHHIFSPILHCHPIALSHKLPTDYKFWSEYNLGMIKVCEELWVLQLYGWQDSKGVQAEIKLALELEKPVAYIEV